MFSLVSLAFFCPVSDDVIDFFFGGEGGWKVAGRVRATCNHRIHQPKVVGRELTGGRLGSLARIKSNIFNTAMYARLGE